MKMSVKRKVLILSDATGTTAEMVVRNALTQFEHKDFELKRFSYVRNKSKVLEAVESAFESGGIIFHTLVSRELRDALLSESLRKNVPTIDLMGPTLKLLSEFCNEPPKMDPGIQYNLSDRYFRRIEAIEYTVTHDDGHGIENLNRADIILTGVSRTSKTPLSIFIANRYSLAIANIPIVPGIELPEKLFMIDQSKIVGLTISPRRLMDVRKARLERVNLGTPTKYVNFDDIIYELRYAHSIFASNGWPVIDVTEKSVEEIALEILSVTNVDVWGQ